MMIYILVFGGGGFLMLNCGEFIVFDCYIFDLFGKFFFLVCFVFIVVVDDLVYVNCFLVVYLVFGVCNMVLILW